MIVRVRTPGGTKRVNVADDATLGQLNEALRAMGVAHALLSRDAALRDPLRASNAPLRSLGIEHGTMLYAGDHPSDGAPKQAAILNQLPTMSKSARETKPNADDGDANVSSTSKCLHGANAVCANCQPDDYTGDKLKWLCAHAPDQRCVNCIDDGEKADTARGASASSTALGVAAGGCNHPSSMSCPNCAFGSAADKRSKRRRRRGTNVADDDDGASGPIDRSKCQHGPGGMCANCLPEETSDDELEMARAAAAAESSGATTRSLRCARHGPHASCVECMTRQDAQKIRLKRQPEGQCLCVAVDSQAAQVFTSYVLETRFEKQRCGFLYGRHKSSGTTLVDAIFEPSQVGAKHSFLLRRDDATKRADRIAELLGWTRVGWIFSTPQRDAPDLTAAEVCKAATLQAEYGNDFVTLVAKQQTAPDGSMTASFEAYQLSDQCVKMWKRGDFESEQHDDANVQLKQTAYVELAETKSVPVDFFLVPVRIRQRSGAYASNFPVANRDRVPPVGKNDLAAHVLALQKVPFLYTVKDFHFLVYLGSLLDMDTDMPNLCAAVRNDEEDQLEGFKILIEAHVS